MWMTFCLRRQLQSFAMFAITIYSGSICAWNPFRLLIESNRFFTTTVSSMMGWCTLNSDFVFLGWMGRCHPNGRNMEM